MLFRDPNYCANPSFYRSQVHVILTIKEREALDKLAELECRSPGEQAYLIIKAELIKRGLLDNAYVVPPEGSNIRNYDIKKY